MSLSYVLIIALLTIISKSSHGQQGHATQRGEIESPRFIKNKRDHFTLVKTNRLLSEVNQEDYRDPKSLVELEKLLNEANSKTVKNEERQSSLPASRSRLSELHRTGSYQQSATEASATKNNNSPRLGGPAKQPSSHRRASTTCAGMKKIVQCKDGVPEEDCKSTLVDQGIEVVSDMPKTPYFSICAYSQEEVDLVAELTSVEDVEDDPPRTLSYVRGSEKLVRQLQFNEQVVPYGVDLVKAREFWGEYRAQGEGVTVCVIDTGLLSSHEDVREGDLSGSKDKDFETWDEDPNSHGTHVTGTIMANDNNIGIVGVAPGASVFVVRVFNEVGDFTASNLIVAMMACEEAGAKIISMSLGGTVNNAAERAAVTRLQDSGILIVAASGNSATGPNMIEYPASYDATMSVGAVGEDAQMAVFSSHNSALDITGPGVDILSLSSFTDAAYSLKSGTSMATPHIAAVAALLWSHFPEASVMDIRTALQETAQDYGACGKDPVFGHGMVDVMAAALYLDNGGVNSTAPELDGCVGVSVSLLTDDWGEETTYRITSENNTQDILYRGGPYVTGQRVTYTEDIQLPDGCYQLIWLDSYGDG
jgi:subtilisin family serine protease